MLIGQSPVHDGVSHGWEVDTSPYTAHEKALQDGLDVEIIFFLVNVSPHSNELAIPCVEVNTAKKRIRMDGTPIQPKDGGEKGNARVVGARLQD